MSPDLHVIEGKSTLIHTQAEKYKRMSNALSCIYSCCEPVWPVKSCQENGNWWGEKTISHYLESLFPDSWEVRGRVVASYVKITINDIIRKNVRDWKTDQRLCEQNLPLMDPMRYIYEITDFNTLVAESQTWLKSSKSKN